MTGTFSYFDIPVALRAETAKRAKIELKALLAGPVTVEQQNKIKAKLARIEQWEAGVLPVDGKTPEPAAPAPVFRINTLG